MDWLFRLYDTNPTAQAIIIIAIVCVAGMAFGSVKYRGIGLGASGVLFAGLLIGHFSKPVDHGTLEFVKEFGLTLFVFCIGLQLGPGFFASLRDAGVRLNALALAVILLGVASAVLFGRWMGLDPAAILGLYSGATTNTPSLGAAQQALISFPDFPAERAALPSIAYAVAYPMGIVGIIGTLLVLKALFRIDARLEVAVYAATSESATQPFERRTLVIENPAIEGITVAHFVQAAKHNVVLSRVRRNRDRQVLLATSHTILHVGDTVLLVGQPAELDRIQREVGAPSGANLMIDSGELSHRRIIVTSKAVLGKTLEELNLPESVGVIVTRVARAEIEMIATAGLRLRFGDGLQVVGSEAELASAANLLGNSVKMLNETQFVPLFAGLAMGIMLGTLPIAFPGLPQPLRIGLAGGTLLVAILLGRIGRIGRMVWHMPRNANLAFREFGIALFFASVGLMAGPKFFTTIASQTGLIWLVCGAVVTILPIMAVGILSRVVLKTNFVVLSGLLAGSMTDPPALSFANSVCQSEAPAVAYATVYPLTMLLRIATAQAMALWLCG